MPERPDPLRWKALGVLCAANFMVILDSQIVLLAIPSIQRDLGFSASGVQWVISAYLLAFGGLLLLGGRIGDLAGRRRTFLAGAALFGAASLACGLAGSPALLLAARVAQGVGAAAMAPTTLAILMTTFMDDEHERNVALALYGGLGGAGATAALLIGGVVTDRLGWPWIFYLNLPVLAGMAVLGRAWLRESRADGPGGADPAGAAALTGASLALLLAVVRAPEAGWGSTQTLGLLAVAAALTAGFAAIEARSRAPLVPLRVFRSRTLVAGDLVMLLVAMCAFGMGITLSLYAQEVLGYSTLQFGFATTAMTAMTLAGSWAAPRLVPRAGTWAVAAGGAGLLLAGSLLLAQVPDDGRYATDILPGLVLFGLGLGAGTIAASIAALSHVPADVAGVASGTNTGAFQLGGALGTAMATALAAGHAGLGDGARAAFTGCAVLAALAVAVAAGVLRRARPR